MTKAYHVFQTSPPDQNGRWERWGYSVEGGGAGGGYASEEAARAAAIKLIAAEPETFVFEVDPAQSVGHPDGRIEIRDRDGKTIGEVFNRPLNDGDTLISNGVRITL
jgi:hypothetical protein